MSFDLTSATLNRAIDRMFDEEVGERDIIHGTITCRVCEEKTAFEMHGGDMLWYSTKDEFGVLDQRVSEDVKAMYSEALLCF